MLLLPPPHQGCKDKTSKTVPVNAMKVYGGASVMNPKYWLHTAKLVQHNSWLTVLKKWLSETPRDINMGRVLMTYKIYQIKKSYNLHVHFFILTLVMQVQRNTNWLSSLEQYQIHVILCTTTFIRFRHYVDIRSVLYSFLPVLWICSILEIKSAVFLFTLHLSDATSTWTLY
jgi:hypothetical protein